MNKLLCCDMPSSIKVRGMTEICNMGFTYLDGGTKSKIGLINLIDMAPDSLIIIGQTRSSSPKGRL